MMSQDETTPDGHGQDMVETEVRDVKSRKIVIVDDDVSFRESLVSLVKSFGFQPCPFASAEELLESDALKDGACLITDVQMPGMSGLELQATLAARGCDIPVIVVTSFPDPQVRQRAMATGAIGVLSKPFDREEMLSLIQSVFRRPRPDPAAPAVPDDMPHLRRGGV